MTDLDERARILRERFDKTFAEPPPAPEPETEPALALRVAGESYVLPLSREVRWVGVCPRIVPLPGGPAEQLGLAGVAGELTVVFSLPLLLGHRSQAHAWLVRVADIALAFDGFEGQIRLAPDARLEPTPHARAHVGGLVYVAEGALPRAVVDLTSILSAVRRR